MAKYKAKKTYIDLDNTKNFKSLKSCSTHLRLKAGLTIEWKQDIPKYLEEHLTEIKDTKVGGKK